MPFYHKQNPSCDVCSESYANNTGIRRIKVGHRRLAVCTDSTKSMYAPLDADKDYCARTAKELWTK